MTNSSSLDAYFDVVVYYSSKGRIIRIPLTWSEV